MEPDNRWIVRSELFDSDCLAEFTGNDAAISRMIIINRGLQVLPADLPCPKTITDEPDTEDFLYRRRTIDSPKKNPSPPDPAFLLVKTRSFVSIEQGKISGKYKGGEK